MLKRLQYFIAVLICFFVLSLSTRGQTFKCFIANDHLNSATQYDIDVYLISTSTDFNVRTVQNCIVFNPAFIPAGASITATYVSGSSQFNSYSIGPLVWSATGYGFQTTVNLGSTCLTGTLITTTTPVRVGTYRLDSNLPFNCVPSYPSMVTQADPSPPGLALKMAVTKWNSLTCINGTTSTITSLGTYSKYVANTAYENVNNMHPVITAHPMSVSNCATGYAAFSVTATANAGITAAVTYQWLENGAPVTNGSTANGVYSGATTATLTISSPAAGLNGNQYSCVVSQCNADTSFVATLTVTNTNDNNVCTTDFCDPVTGLLSHTPIPGVIDNNPCTEDVCNSISGAISHPPISVNDNNACTTDGCNTNMGVYHNPVSIDDNNLCTDDVCDSANGSIAHVAVQVDDNNACTTDACDTNTGIISHTLIDVNDNNPCTADACNPVTGLVTHNPVSISDNNGCTTDGCDTSTGIYHIPININDNNACTFDYCNSINGVVSHPLINVNDNNVCTTDGCDTATGVFHNAPNINDNDACTADVCDSVTGIVSHTPEVINDNDACTVDGCDSVNGVFHIPPLINDNNACTNDICNSVTGLISHPALNNNDNNACTTDGCNTLTGVFHTPVSITDNNPCTADACNSITGIITHTSMSISDNDTCTFDACNTITGITTHTDITPPAPFITVTNLCGNSILTAGGFTGVLLWSTSAVSNSITTQNPGVYTVTQTISGCTGPAGSATASPVPLPFVWLGNDTSLATGSVLTLDAGAVFVSYLWSTGDTIQHIDVQTTGSYSVTVTDQNGCTNTDEITVSFVSTAIETVGNRAIQIFPNPANNLIFIYTDEKIAPADIGIFNVNGQYIGGDCEILKEGNRIQINTTSLTSGVYFIRMKTVQQVKSGIFVKQ